MKRVGRGYLISTLKQYTFYTWFFYVNTITLNHSWTFPVIDAMQAGYDLCRPSSLLFVVMLKWYWCWKNIKVHFIFYCFTELFSMCYSLLINKEFYVNVNQTFHFFDQRLIFAFPCCFDAIFIFKCRLIGTSQVISLLNNVFLVKKNER